VQIAAMMTWDVVPTEVYYCMCMSLGYTKHLFVTEVIDPDRLTHASNSTASP